jgi:IS30 family transposase
MGKAAPITKATRQKIATLRVQRKTAKEISQEVGLAHSTVHCELVKPEMKMMIVDLVAANDAKLRDIFAAGVSRIHRVINDPKADDELAMRHLDRAAGMVKQRDDAIAKLGELADSAGDTGLELEELLLLRRTRRLVNAAKAKEVQGE